MQKICKNCSQAFDVASEDQAYYTRIDVPEPTWCPPCREMRRMAWCNEGTLYNRNCDLTGKPIVSEFSPANPRKVYSVQAWWGDGWDPLSYGRDFDFNRPFFEQFHEFTPELNTRCPLLKNGELPSGLSNNDQCLDYIDRISSCETIVSIPYKYSSLTSSCQDYVTQNTNYKTCLEKHKDDVDFYLPEWRIYLGRSEEMWKKKRETITLYDDKNNIVDSESY